MNSSRSIRVPWRLCSSDRPTCAWAGCGDLPQPARAVRAVPDDVAVGGLDINKPATCVRQPARSTPAQSCTLLPRSGGLIGPSVEAAPLLGVGISDPGIARLVRVARGSGANANRGYRRSDAETFYGMGRRLVSGSQAALRSCRGLRGCRGCAAGRAIAPARVARTAARRPTAPCHKGERHQHRSNRGHQHRRDDHG